MAGARGWRGRRRLGLRSRVTAALAVGALLLVLVLSVITYGVVRTYLLRQRETSAVRQTFVNARLISTSLRSADVNVPRALASLGDVTSDVLVLRRGEWFGSSVAFGRDDLPADLRGRVAGDGRAARERFRHSGRPRLAVGVPVPAVDAAYFQVFSFDELERTLRTITFSLAGAGATTALGAAALGRWVSGRVLRPLGDVSEAATSIAGGRLETRLEVASDPELRQLADSFNQMADALEQRIQRDARFASDVSHELRSPLTTLSAALEVLETRRADLPPRSQTALDLLAAEVLRFRRLVEDLLEISRVDAEAVELAIEDVRATELLLHAAESWPSVISVEVDPAATTATVQADKRRLERVIANLLDNADKHAGGATSVAIRRTGDEVQILVDDAGHGVAEGQRHTIFERFARGSSGAGRTRTAGAGLGLALAAEHVRLHRGRIWVEQSPAGGARFVVALPVSEPDDGSTS